MSSCQNENESLKNIEFLPQWEWIVEKQWVLATMRMIPLKSLSSCPSMNYKWLKQRTNIFWKTVIYKINGILFYYKLFFKLRIYKNDPSQYSICEHHAHTWCNHMHVVYILLIDTYTTYMKHRLVSLCITIVITCIIIIILWSLYKNDPSQYSICEHHAHTCCNAMHVVYILLIDTYTTYKKHRLVTLYYSIVITYIIDDIA